MFLSIYYIFSCSDTLAFGIYMPNIYIYVYVYISQIHTNASDVKNDSTD